MFLGLRQEIVAIEEDHEARVIQEAGKWLMKFFLVNFCLFFFFLRSRSPAPARERERKNSETNGDAVKY